MKRSIVMDLAESDYILKFQLRLLFSIMYKEWQMRDEEISNLLPMSQWTFFVVILRFSIGRGAMRALRPWNLRKEHLASVRVFLSAVGFCFHNCQLKTKEVRETLKGSHMTRDRQISKISAPHNLRKPFRLTLLSARSILLDSGLKSYFT